MAHPKRAKGFRNIVVDGQPYRWRLTSALRNMGEAKGTHATLTLQGPVSGRQQVIVALPKWHDPWILFPVVSPNDPGIVTPEFASQALRFAVANGWEPVQPGPAMRLVYQNKEFRPGNGRNAKNVKTN